jgi:hypothetical protein
MAGSTGGEGGFLGQRPNKVRCPLLLCLQNLLPKCCRGQQPRASGVVTAALRIACLIPAVGDVSVPFVQRFFLNGFFGSQ